jgi:hypothetical protein
MEKMTTKAPKIVYARCGGLTSNGWNTMVTSFGGYVLFERSNSGHAAKMIDIAVMLQAGRPLGTLSLSMRGLVMDRASVPKVVDMHKGYGLW